MTYDEILIEDADKLLCFGNEYASVIAVENAATKLFSVNEGSDGYGDTGTGNTPSVADETRDRHNTRSRVESDVNSIKDDVGDTKKFNHAIKALTAAAAAVTGGAAATAVNAVKNSDSGTGKTAGIVALASAVVTAAGAIGQHVHDKHRVQKLKADSLEKLDDKLEDITVKLNTAGPGEKRELLVARDALKKAKNEIVKL